MEIIPAILTNSPEELRQKISILDEIGGRVQIDIIDGQFAENKTIDPSIIEEIPTYLRIDYQLMTKEPIDWVERAVRGLADRIIGHIEMMSNQMAFVGKVQEVGASPGLALDIDTPVAAIDKTALASIDVVLLMSVKAGWGGQEFEERVIPKIVELSKIRLKDAIPFKICVDGGITYDTIKKVAKVEADEVAIGRKLFEGDLRTNIESFKKIVE